MAQWVVETTDVPSGKSKDSDWREIASVAKKSEALRVMRKTRANRGGVGRYRTHIDYARGGMAG